jgi:hypothetical protein
MYGLFLQLPEAAGRHLLKRASFSGDRRNGYSLSWSAGSAVVAVLQLSDKKEGPFADTISDLIVKATPIVTALGLIGDLKAE